MFYCDTCDKEFKNAGGFNGHLRSKAHLAKLNGPGLPETGSPVVDYSGEPSVQADPSDDELARLRAENEALKRQAENASPFAILPELNDPEAVVSVFSRDAIREKVINTIANENEKRFKAGKPALHTQDGFNAYLEKEMDAWIQREIEGWKEDHPTIANPWRSVKMVFPNRKGSYRYGEEGVSIRQIALEAQVQAGSMDPTAPIQKMIAKGAKIISPLLCMRSECYREAALANGVYTFSGYCSQEHRIEVEGGVVEGQFNKTVNKDLDPYATDGALVASGVLSMTAANR